MRDNQPANMRDPMNWFVVAAYVLFAIMTIFGTVVGIICGSHDFRLTYSISSAPVTKYHFTFVRLFFSALFCLAPLFLAGAATFGFVRARKRIARFESIALGFISPLFFAALLQAPLLYILALRYAVQPPFELFRLMRAVVTNTVWSGEQWSETLLGYHVQLMGLWGFVWLAVLLFELARTLISGSRGRLTGAADPHGVITGGGANE